MAEVISHIQEEKIGQVISDEDSPNFEVFKFKALRNRFVSPGTLVAARIAENDLLIGRVTASHEQNPHFLPNRVAVRDSLEITEEPPGEEVSVTIYRIYEAESLNQVFIENGNHIISPPDVLPKSGSDIIIPTREIITEVLGIRNEIEGGLHIGNLASTITPENELPIVLNREIIQRHVFIGGTTGSGKSYAAKVLVEEIHKLGLPIILFDTQNEFVPLTNELDGQVLVPGTDYTIRLSQLTESEVFEMVPTLSTDLQRSILAMAFLRLQREIINHQRIGFDLNDLIATIETVCRDTAAADSTARLVTTRVRHYIQGYDFIGTGFNWNQVLRQNSVIDIDCSGVDRTRLQLILAATMRELQNLRRSQNIPPYVIMIDEAHLFVPQEEGSAAKEIIREGVRIGRHHGICIVLITQSPIDIDKKAIRQCNTRLIFALETDQLQSLQGVKADATESMLKKLPKSPRGTCILSGTYESVRHAFPVEIRQMETENADGGQAPDIFEIINTANWRSEASGN